MHTCTYCTGKLCSYYSYYQHNINLVKFTSSWLANISSIDAYIRKVTDNFSYCKINLKGETVEIFPHFAVRKVWKQNLTFIYTFEVFKSCICFLIHIGQNLFWRFGTNLSETRLRTGRTLPSGTRPNLQRQQNQRAEWIAMIQIIDLITTVELILARILCQYTGIV